MKFIKIYYIFTLCFLLSENGAYGSKSNEQNVGLVQTLDALRFGSQNYDHLGEPFATYYKDLEELHGLIYEFPDQIRTKYKDETVGKHHHALQFIFGFAQSPPELDYNEPIQTLLWQVVPEDCGFCKKRLYDLSSLWLLSISDNIEELKGDLNLRRVLAFTLERIFYGSDRRFRTSQDLRIIYKIHKIEMPKLGRTEIRKKMASALTEFITDEGELESIIDQVSADVDFNRQALEIYRREFFDTSSHTYAVRKFAKDFVMSHGNKDQSIFSLSGLESKELNALDELKTELKMFVHFADLEKVDVLSPDILAMFIEGEFEKN